MTLLGVNIDHIATVRNARTTRYPSPVEAAIIAEMAGADLITLHLREDRRHIRCSDVKALKKVNKSRMNLEMALTDEMLEIALEVKPDDVCLVPERRDELTTEGGLDVIRYFKRVQSIAKVLTQAGIRVSVFIDPEPLQVRAACAAGVPVVELHTGAYAEAETTIGRETELARLNEAVEAAECAGLVINAGHGLSYENVKPVAAIPAIVELNIGHAIISRALFVGLEKAVKEMKVEILSARAR